MVASAGVEPACLGYEPSDRPLIQLATCILACVLLFTSPAFAQEAIPYAWTSHEAIPARISDALVGAQIAASIWDDWRSEHRMRAFVEDACAAGLTVLAAEGIKRLVKRERPNHFDNKSTPSMHTGVATSLAGWRPAWGASFAIGVGWGRGASKWHYTSDIAFGALLGYGAARACAGIEP